MADSNDIQTIFTKLDTITEKLNDFRVEVEKGFGGLPCSAHHEAIKGVKDRFMLIGSLILILVTAVAGLAFKSFS